MQPIHRRARLLSAALISSAVSLALHAASAPVSLEGAAQALRSGDATRAAEIYETLSQQGESLEAETGLVRALLQSGQFRKAVSCGNLVAGEHPESADAQALLAFLNDRTGRTEQAIAALQKLEAAAPGQWSPVAVHAEILIDRNAPDKARLLIEHWRDAHPGTQVPELERLKARAASVAGAPRAGAGADAHVATTNAPTWLATSFQPLPIAGRRITGAGNGVVIDGGRTVLTYSAVVPARAKDILVRNGLGRVTRARIDHAGAGNGTGAGAGAGASGTSGSAGSATVGDLIRLQLVTPFPATSSLPPDRIFAPEGVRFCFVLAFSTPNAPDAAHPAIAPGLVFRANTGLGGLMQITSSLGAGQDGAPVFDARGKLIGLALGSGDHQVAGQSVRKALGQGTFALRVDEALPGVTHATATTLTPPGKQPPMPSVEELFERLAPAVVQIVAVE